MFHLVAFTSSIAQAGLNQVTFLSGGADFTPLLGSGMTTPAKINRIAGIAGLSANLRRVQVQHASFKPYPYLNIGTVNRGTAFESPVRFRDYTDAPIDLKVTEELDVFAYQGGAGAERVYVGIWLSDGPMPPRVFPNMRTVRLTGATTLTANVWTAVPLTLDESLPGGEYAIVGMRAFGATALLARVSPVQGGLYKPGVVAVQAYDQLDIPDFREGRSGEFVRFPQNLVPQVEYLASAADTAQEVWFDVVPVGPNPNQSP